MPITIVSDDAPVPGAGKRATDNQEYRTFYDETLRPRGVPSSAAITVRVDNETEADDFVRAIRAYAGAETPKVGVGRRVKNVANLPIDSGPWDVTVWLKEYTTRTRKPKDAVTTDTATDTIVDIADVPNEDAVDAVEDAAPAPVDVPTFLAADELATVPDSVPEHHERPARKRGWL